MEARYLQLYVRDLSPILIEEFKQRNRSLEIYIDNETSEDLAFVDSYFFTGGMFPTEENPRDVPRNSGCVYFLASGLAGVSGGWKFKVLGTNLYLYLGFENPLVGCYKTFVSLTSDGQKPAVWSYEKAEDETTKNVACGKYMAEVKFADPHYSPYKRIRCTISYIMETA